MSTFVTSDAVFFRCIPSLNQFGSVCFQDARDLTRIRVSKDFVPTERNTSRANFDFAKGEAEMFHVLMEHVRQVPTIVVLGYGMASSLGSGGDGD
jgi:hypothetical protein